MAALALVCGLVGSGLAAAADTAPGASPPGVRPRLLGCDRAAERVTVTASTVLDPSCTYTGGIVVAASGVTLDCRGAAIRSPLRTGRGIEVSTPVDVTMERVTIRRCVVEGFLNGIRITRTGFRALPAGHEYDHALRDVVIEDTEVRSTGGVGIFVDGYVSGVTLRRVHVEGAGSAGVYLEAGSRDNVVEDSELVRNGFGENGPEGALFTLGGATFRFWGTGREGLAIDGSYRNVVRRNRFEGNAAGGIFVYTNCGEFVRERPGSWFERRFGADDNLIEANRFVGGWHGVWIGARMGENTFPMDCSDPAYVSGPLLHVSLDRARRNVVRDNDFVDTSYGVRVEDDGTVVAGNHFSGTGGSQHAIVVGTRYRTAALDHPVSDTVVARNVSTIAGNSSPYRWVHGVRGLRASGNRALGVPVGVCEGRPLPANGMIFVLAAVLEDPSGPPTPRPPGLALPVLGPLPPCAAGAVPEIVPGTATVVEGGGGTRAMQVPVRLSAPPALPVSATWTTAVVPRAPAAQATPGVDYEASSGVVRFAPGQTEAFVTVPLLDDATVEPEEIVVVGLANAANARVGGYWGLGFGVVVDDDGARASTFSPS